MIIIVIVLALVLVLLLLMARKRPARTADETPMFVPDTSPMIVDSNPVDVAPADDFTPGGGDFGGAGASGDWGDGGDGGDGD